MNFIESIFTRTKILFVKEKIFENTYRIALFVSKKSSPRILFLVDPAVSGAVEIAEEISRKSDSIVFTDMQQNPDVDLIKRVVNDFRKYSPDIVWGIGGGSTMDTAKAVAVMIEEESDFEEFLHGIKPIEKRKRFLIATPTTAGTGAEVTRFGVYTDRSGRKISLASPYLQPDYAVLIPELTYGMPPFITASTAFDALTHALEVLWNKHSNFILDELATGVAAEIIKNMERAFESSVTESTDGRDEMLYAATKAGIAFNITGTAAIHALSFPLSEEWHLPHGAACAFFIEDVWNLNIKNQDVRKKLNRLALLTGYNNAEELLTKILQVRRKMKLPSNFEDAGIKEEKEKLIEMFMKTLNDFKMKNNVVEVTPHIIERIISRKTGDFTLHL